MNSSSPRMANSPRPSRKHSRGKADFLTIRADPAIPDLHPADLDGTDPGLDLARRAVPIRTSRSRLAGSFMSSWRRGTLRLPARPLARAAARAGLKDVRQRINAKVVHHGRYVAFQMAEVAIPEICSPTSCGSSRNCDHRPMRCPRKAFDCHASEPNPRERCVLITTSSATSDMPTEHDGSRRPCE